MQQPGRFKFLATRRNRQRGQAYAEYLVVTALLIVAAIAITWGTFDDSEFGSLVHSLKSFFGAYSFTLSLP